ncbi:hypothetical protein GZ77_00415 [Endozoicomonas montiporae]|uniref:Uncharacterized protein n=2 Tax=Endozoicomonas montiporae TaxID=1027273 RepID=A0A081N9S6_9GAMM|nr:hypothetical protein [Endozoicomonas montiporae]AMO55056.1 hypothetical protein EZMO1_0831 [Endozoicomonas montiporae CL-33]KEQ15199.1 hypothetical protein GZ77_00415 [Endozoicomonas montiporae]
MENLSFGEYDTAGLEQGALELHDEAVSLVNRRKAELKTAKKDLSKQEDAVKSRKNILKNSASLQRSIARGAESKLSPLGNSSGDLKLHLENLNSAKRRMVNQRSDAKKLLKSIPEKERKHGFTLTDEKRSLAKATQKAKQKIGQLDHKIKQTKVELKSALASEKQKALQEKQEKLLKKQEQLQAEREKLQTDSDQNTAPAKWSSGKTKKAPLPPVDTKPAKKRQAPLPPGFQSVNAPATPPQVASPADSGFDPLDSIDQLLEFDLEETTNPNFTDSDIDTVKQGVENTIKNPSVDNRTLENFLDDFVEALNYEYDQQGTPAHHDWAPLLSGFEQGLRALENGQTGTQALYQALQNG